MEDKIIEACNPGIRGTVRWLRAYGFNTCDSGDGETHEHTCDRDYPYVSIHVEPGQMVDASRRLWDLLRRNGVDVEAQGDQVPCIQASYDPANDTAIVDLMYVNDASLVQAGVMW